jgi:hypothetical protein
MSFQNTVLFTAIVIFLILMVIIAVMMKNAKNSQAFPPQIGNCPDYWTLDKSKCKNLKGLGTNAPVEADFTSKKYQGKNGNSEKCKWAKSYNLEWDGITNMNIC